MKTIYKYMLKDHGVVDVEMPAGARILTAKAQGMHVWVWAIVETDTQENETRRFAVLKTGAEIDLETEVMTHVESVQFDDGGLVYHIFEYPEE